MVVHFIITWVLFSPNTMVVLACLGQRVRSRPVKPNIVQSRDALRVQDARPPGNPLHTAPV